jgi:hypothetical protein
MRTYNRRTVQAENMRVASLAANSQMRWGGRPPKVRFAPKATVSERAAKLVMPLGSCPAAVSATSDLAVESGEVVERLDTRKEEIAAAFYGREGWQTLYLSSDRPLRDRHIVAAVLSTDYRIAFIA